MKDYLGLHLRDVPYFRALLRAVEARFYQEFKLPSPTLDLGSGDGHFASLAFDQPPEVGVDPWWGPTRAAARLDVYPLLACAEGAHLPFPDQYFASAVSNSVLEHIPDLDPVLREMHRVLQPGARFAFCVPNRRFTEGLATARFFDRVGLTQAGDSYRRFFNRISRHQHTDNLPVWKSRLARSGFEIERYWHYFSPRALRVLEWGHYFGLPALVSKLLFGRWILARGDWNLWLTRRLLSSVYQEDPVREDGAYTFYLSRRL